MKEYFGRLIEQALPRRPCGKPLEIWFQDEARVGRKWTHAYVRAPIGTRPPVLRDNKFCNLVSDSRDAVLNACKEEWRSLTDDPNRIVSIGNRERATIRSWRG